MVGVILEDGVVRLRPLGAEDVDEWMTGEDDEQIRWFEFPGPAPRENVVQAIDAWTKSWITEGPVRQWAICDNADGRILGGVEVRDLGHGEINLSYVVFPSSRRRGIATRASQLALVYAAREMGATVAVIKIRRQHRFNRSGTPTACDPGRHHTLGRGPNTRRIPPRTRQPPVTASRRSGTPGGRSIPLGSAHSSARSR